MTITATLVTPSSPGAIRANTEVVIDVQSDVALTGLYLWAQYEQDWELIYHTAVEPFSPRFSAGSFEEDIVPSLHKRLYLNRLGGWPTSSFGDPAPMGIFVNGEVVAMSKTVYGVPAGVRFSELTTEVVLGGFYLDPATIPAGTITYEFCGTHQAANGSLELRLYEMGDGTSAASPVLRSTLTIALANVGIRRRETVTLTTTASPGTNADQISTSARVYELRAYLNSTDVNAIAFVSEGGITVG